MARKGKSTEEIIGFLCEAEVRIAPQNTARFPSRATKCCSDAGTKLTKSRGVADVCFRG
jgi:hypothetical protein